jgi:hypothetical protein
VVRLTDKQRDLIQAINGFAKGVQYGRVDLGRHYVKRRSALSKVALVGRAVVDYVFIFLTLLSKRSETEVYFVSSELLEYSKFIAQNSRENALLVSYHPTKRVSRVNGKRVYNIGILIGAISRLLGKKGVEDLVSISDMVYRPIYRPLRGKTVYIPCFHDFNGYVLMFNVHRRKYRLVEVQHGGICNYFPFREPVSFPLVDKIYVNNLRTKRYLLEHLYRDVDVEISLKDRDAAVSERIDNDKPIVLYCSTIELRGIHPVMLEFLRHDRYVDNYELVVRLHPREKGRKDAFVEQLSETKVHYRFDDSADWLIGNNYSRMIVISPWSSVLEQAYDNGIAAIVVDGLGRERFAEIIDGQILHYSDNLADILPSLLEGGSVRQ